MAELIFMDLNDEEKIILLDSLGYGVDGKTGLIIDNQTRQLHICPLTNKRVFLKDASILPGSTIIINTSAITLSEYFSEYMEKEPDKNERH